MNHSTLATWSRRLAAVMALAAAGASMHMSPASAVTGGSSDGNAHPYAVGIIQPGHSSIGCSGVLDHAGASPPEVLTAAHCLYTGSISGRATVVFTGSAPSARRTIAADVQIDPRYSQSTHMHDLAVLRLASAAPVAAASLAAVGTLDRSPSRSYVTVGYGEPYRGQRRSATESLVRVSQGWLSLTHGTGNSCNGDSGGPDLLPGSSTVVAMTDQGSCTDSQDLRLDTTWARAFIAQAAGASVPASLSRNRIPLGQSVSLRTTLPARAAGRTLLRQGFYSGAWHTWASQVVRRDGTASFVIAQQAQHRPLPALPDSEPRCRCGRQPHARPCRVLNAVA